ncbi:unnamed protein product [Urochloa decumbens]|uniref:KIB1-4 beta-propeller domain-containing protein n=1 Tax=Urochloa decumbens TaxID=240449 RepID=A0ABC9FFU5_9POAL
METIQNEGSLPPLDPTLAPVLLFDYAGGAGGGEASDGRLLYSIPTRRSLLARGARRFIDDVNWVTPQGWVLTLDPATRDASLMDPFTSRKVSLPPDTDSIVAGSGSTRCFLSTPTPADEGCVVLAVHLTDPVLCYCHPGGSRWFRHEYRPEDVDADGAVGAMALLTGAGAGRFHTYLSTPTNKLATLELLPEPVLTTTRVVNRPCSTGCCYIKYWKLESCGELFMVRFCYSRLSDKRVSRVEVQRLDWSTSAWVKVTELGVNRVFFVRWGQFGASMAADELGLKGNCVYFTLNGDKGLYVYNMERGTTTLHNPGLDVPDSMEPLILMRVNPNMT